MANVTVTVAVQDAAGPTTLDGVTVQVYDAAGTSFITEGTTGAPFAAGDVEFTLPGDGPGITYTLRLSLVGWRFPNGATLQILVTDPPAPDNDFGPEDALLGSLEELATLVVKDDQPAPVEVDEVKIRVYTSPADVFVAEVETGQAAEAAGAATLPLSGSVTPGTEYIVRLSKPGVTFDPGPTQTIAVLDPLVPPATNIFDFTAVIATLPESLDSDMCKLSGVFVDQSLIPIAGLVIEFKPAVTFPEMDPRFTYHFAGDPVIVRDNILLRSVRVTTNADGYAEVELPREGCYQVHIHGYGHPKFITEIVQVPDRAGLAMLDLLFPFVTEVQFGVATVDLAVDEEETVDITVTASNGQDLENAEFIGQLLEFETSDDSVATVILSDDGVITVTGVGAGTATVVVTRVVGTVPPRRPTAAALIVGTVDITVT